MSILFREYELLGQSGLFDADYYRRANPDIAGINMDPLLHYLERGCHEGRDPSAAFDTGHYLRQCQSLGDQPDNALLHYITVGSGRGLTPSPAGPSLVSPNANRPNALTPPAAVHGFTGPHAFQFASELVLMEIDAAIFCPPQGLLLQGWLLCRPDSIRAIRVRSGESVCQLDAARWARIARPDVIAAVGRDQGFADERCGFIGYVSGLDLRGKPAHIEVELLNGELGFRSLRPTSHSGLSAIRQVLGAVQIIPSEIDHLFDNVLGPAVAAINCARLLQPRRTSERIFGRMPESPLCTLIVTLYGRVDFLEHQIALLARDPGIREVEIIYVLDDPPKRPQLEGLALSVYERFRIPFRVLFLSENLGFAPANNAGLRCANAPYVCFLNSDILPIADGWLQRLVQQLVDHEDLGIVGATLLFEDGSIQHEGCEYFSHPEFGDWTCIRHPNKGRRPRETAGLRHFEVITGACMVMRRSLAVEMQGFDESFIVGDFEDGDLCQRVKGRGLACAVDRATRLYHLERKSQAGPDQTWRMNLTLYNAWVHQRRWFDASKGQTDIEAAQLY